LKIKESISPAYPIFLTQISAMKKPSKAIFVFLFYISTVMVSKGAETNCLDFVMQLFAQKGLFFTKELFFGRVARANYKSF
jgi:hypothetical protein